MRKSQTIFQEHNQGTLSTAYMNEAKRKKLDTLFRTHHVQQRSLEPERSSRLRKDEIREKVQAMRLNEASVIMDQELSALGSVDLRADQCGKLPQLSGQQSLQKKQILDSNSNSHLFMIEDEKRITQQSPDSVMEKDLDDETVIEPTCAKIADDSTANYLN